MVEQGDDAVADEACRGVGAGNDELEEARQQLLFVESLVVVARRDEHTDEVVAGRVAMRRHQLLQVGNDRVRGSDRLRRRRTAPRLEQGPEPAVHRLLVRQRDAEQLADHPERQRMGEALDQIDGGAGLGGRELVEEFVDDVNDGGFQRGDPLRGECSGDELAQPGVILSVDGEHVPGECRTGKSFVHDARILVECGEEVLRESCVTEGLASGIVPDHQPGLVPVGQVHLVHRALRSHRCEQGVWVALCRRVPSSPSREV